MTEDKLVQVELTNYEFLDKKQFTYTEIFGFPMYGGLSIDLLGRFWVRFWNFIEEKQAMYNCRIYGANTIHLETFSAGLHLSIWLFYDHIVFIADKRVPNYRIGNFYEAIVMLREPHEYRVFPRLIEEDAKEREER